ncbi:hypothetical protein BDV95DRAFT_569084 [Massariosphaeria phaeospora]|uniref:Uncharacterized protein n=1 Tax=Massariosphaeria phaeospora TaxID=100035 RepID=A0A7C8M9Z9_9PLEO|nr:hypothetical protein BDV95DRAFT_569084 [Massariosphaeria phaeospora]
MTWKSWSWPFSLTVKVTLPPGLSSIIGAGTLPVFSPLGTDLRFLCTARRIEEGTKPVHWDQS